MKIIFIQTGGTIDKDYPRPTKGYAFEIGDAALVRILEKANPQFEFEVLPLLKKDSLDMADKDRERIYEACMKADSDRIIITHGTDTIIETAEKLSRIENKVIVLTGATRPERFSDSDAAFNVGTAVGAVNVLEPGVYIAMNGRIYAWDCVKRDPRTGRFAEK